MIMADSFKAIITAGGIGTRLLPFSKEIPKEMAPLLALGPDNTPVVKPMIQAIFEQLFDYGIRDFFVVVGREKRAIEDHFTPDPGFVELLSRKGKKADSLLSFYDKVKKSNLVFLNQSEPSGFGDAVLTARRYVQDDFMVHAGDTYVMTKNASHLKRLRAVHIEQGADATILLENVKDPRQYGVVTGSELSDGRINIEKAVEKPDEHVSNTAIMPVYIFNSFIFDALTSIKPGKRDELQLTDAIQLLISKGRKVVGVKLRSEEIRLDIGSPETLIEALTLSSKAISSS